LPRNSRFFAAGKFLPSSLPPASVAGGMKPLDFVPSANTPRPAGIRREVGTLSAVETNLFS